MHELMSNDITIQMGKRDMDVVHKNRKMDDWAITFAETGMKAQTGTRLKRVEKYIDSDWFLSTYGDGLSNVDIPAEIAFHQRSKATATIAGVHPHSKFGLIEADAGGLIKRFTEKPVLYDYVNGGFHVFQKEVFDSMSNDDNCVLEQDVFSRLVAGKKLAMFRHDGFWHAMDTYKDYLELNGMWDEGVRPWKVWSD
jgi:glucose-1-phosphate cytidylyltransferase